MKTLMRTSLLNPLLNFAVMLLAFRYYKNRNVEAQTGFLCLICGMGMDGRVADILTHLYLDVEEADIDAWSDRMSSLNSAEQLREVTGTGRRLAVIRRQAETRFSFN